MEELWRANGINWQMTTGVESDITAPPDCVVFSTLPFLVLCNYKIATIIIGDWTELAGSRFKVKWDSQWNPLFIWHSIKQEHISISVYLSIYSICIHMKWHWAVEFSPSLCVHAPSPGFILPHLDMENEITVSCLSLCQRAHSKPRQCWRYRPVPAITMATSLPSLMRGQKRRKTSCWLPPSSQCYGSANEEIPVSFFFFFLPLSSRAGHAIYRRLKRSAPSAFFFFSIIHSESNCCIRHHGDAWFVKVMSWSAGSHFNFAPFRDEFLQEVPTGRTCVSRLNSVYRCSVLTPRALVCRCEAWKGARDVSVLVSTFWALCDSDFINIITPLHIVKKKMRWIISSNCPLPSFASM